jgi:hypothetical protein
VCAYRQRADTIRAPGKIVAGQPILIDISSCPDHTVYGDLHINRREAIYVRAPRVDDRPSDVERCP